MQGGDHHAVVAAPTHPRITFDIVLADPPRLKERDLRGRRVDLVMSNVTAELAITEDEFETTVLQQSPQHPIAAHNSRWATRKKIDFADLVGERWVLPRPDHTIRIALNESFHSRGLPLPQPVVTVGSPNIIAAMVLQFGYLGVMGDIVLKTSPLGTQLWRLPIRLPAHDNLRVGSVTLRNRMLSPVAQLFIETAREVVAELAQT